MKTIDRDEQLGFPDTSKIIFFLLVLIAAYVFATHSPSMAQSGPANLNILILSLLRISLSNQTSNSRLWSQ
jgi:hypothetical protein